MILGLQKEMQMKISLQRPYIIQKIEPNSFKTIINSTYQTAYRLYLIASGIKEIQSFYKNTNDNYYVSATVKTEAAPVGQVRNQVWNVKHLHPILNKKPRYSLKVSVTNKATNKEEYSCKLTTIKESIIYDQIQECVLELDVLLK
jgi:hypothetical protein